MKLFTGKGVKLPLFFEGLVEKLPTTFYVLIPVLLADGTHGYRVVRGGPLFYGAIFVRREIYGVTPERVGRLVAAADKILSVVRRMPHQWKHRLLIKGGRKKA